MTQNEILKRLAYIKHLYKQAIEQSKQPETINYSCILSFHDAIDWFMSLACMKRGITDANKINILSANSGHKKTKNSIALMDYFAILPDLQVASEIEKINKLRNALKHDFVLPSKLAVSESISTSTIFFEVNTKIVFNLMFSEISLTDLLSIGNVKEYLKKAEGNILASMFEDAMEEIAKAYDELIQTDDELLKNKWSFWSSNYKKIWTYQIPVSFEKNEKSLERLGKSLKEVGETVNINMGRIDESIKILSLGIDYRKYRKLMSLIPVVYRSANGKVIMSKPKYEKNELANNTQFAFDFVLECALKVQDFSLA